MDTIVMQFDLVIFTEVLFHINILYGLTYKRMKIYLDSVYITTIVCNYIHRKRGCYYLPMPP